MTTKTTSNVAVAAAASAVTVVTGENRGCGDNSGNANSSEVFLCSICCYKKTTVDNLTTISQKCQHKACKDCIIQWIVKEENSGQDTPTTCPFCRLKLDDKEVVAVLGRSFQPKRAHATSPHDFSTAAAGVTELDDLTIQWLQSQTKQCPSCGAHIEKLDGGSCDLMECLCGYRFCYDCGRQGANSCRCSPINHGFWDNILDRLSPRRVVPLQASADEQTGAVDLKSHIEQKKKKDRIEQLRRNRARHHNDLMNQYRDFETFDNVERDIVNGKWLFCSKTNSIRVLQQMRGYEKRHTEKIEALYERGIRALDYRLYRQIRFQHTAFGYDSMVPPPHIQNGWWLFGVKSEKAAFRMLSEQALAVNTRQQRTRNQELRMGEDLAFHKYQDLRSSWLHVRES